MRPGVGRAAHPGQTTSSGAWCGEEFSLRAAGVGRPWVLPPLERRREAELRRGVRDAEWSCWYRQFAGVEATEASEAGDHATRAGVEEGSKERRRDAICI